MTWEEIKELGKAARNQEIARRVAESLVLYNGCIAETARELDMSTKVLQDQIKSYPQLKRLVDSTENRAKTKQPNWRK